MLAERMQHPKTTSGLSLFGPLFPTHPAPVKRPRINRKGGRIPFLEPPPLRHIRARVYGEEIMFRHKVIYGGRGMAPLFTPSLKPFGSNLRDRSWSTEEGAGGLTRRSPPPLESLRKEQLEEPSPRRFRRRPPRAPESGFEERLRHRTQPPQPRPFEPLP